MPNPPTTATATAAASPDGPPPGAGLVATPEPGSAGPGFGVATATFVVVSSMVGTGVLTTSGFSVYLLGSNQAMLALWVVGAVLAVCGALTLCELTALLPRSGGDYIFLRAAYGPAVAFLSGWVSFLIGFGGPIALSSWAASRYLLAPLDLAPRTAEVARLGLASALILALAAVHCRSRAASIRVQGGMTLVKLLILGTLAVGGVALGWGRWASLADQPPLTGDLVLGMASSLVYVMYAYTGWNAAGYLAGEATEPQRTMPRAILLGTGGVAVLYLTLNLAYALALPVASVRAIVADAGGQIDAVQPIAQLAAERLVGPRVAAPLAVAIGLTMMASVSAYILTGPRVLMAMAASGQFPAWAGRVSERGVPVRATALQVAWSLVLLWSGQFEPVLTYASVGLTLFSMLTISAVFVLRWRLAEAPRPFRTPGYPLPPLVFLLGSGLLVLAKARERPLVVGLSVGSVLLGIPTYYAWRALGGGSGGAGRTAGEDAAAR